LKIFIFNALYNYKLMQDLEHENYMLKSILETSPSSESFSFDEYRKVSPAYYNDLMLQLLEKYQDKKLTDIEGSKVIETPYGDTLEIVQKEKIDAKELIAGETGGLAFKTATKIELNIGDRLKFFTRESKKRTL